MKFLKYCVGVEKHHFSLTNFEIKISWADDNFLKITVENNSCFA